MAYWENLIDFGIPKIHQIFSIKTLIYTHSINEKSYILQEALKEYFQVSEFTITAKSLSFIVTHFSSNAKTCVSSLKWS